MVHRHAIPKLVQQPLASDIALPLRPVAYNPVAIEIPRKKTNRRKLNDNINQTLAETFFSVVTVHPGPSSSIPKDVMLRPYDHAMKESSVWCKVVKISDPRNGNRYYSCDIKSKNRNKVPKNKNKDKETKEKELNYKRKENKIHIRRK